MYVRMQGTELWNSQFSFISLRQFKVDSLCEAALCALILLVDHQNHKRTVSIGFRWSNDSNINTSRLAASVQWLLFNCVSVRGQAVVNV
jgi:hypothetical protein